MSKATDKSRPPGAPWSLTAAAKYLQISPRHLRRFVSARAIKTIRIGSRRLVPAAEVARVATKGL